MSTQKEESNLLIWPAGNSDYYRAVPGSDASVTGYVFEPGEEVIFSKKSSLIS